jgi:hypothetical protein
LEERRESGRATRKWKSDEKVEERRESGRATRKWKSGENVEERRECGRATRTGKSINAALVVGRKRKTPYYGNGRSGGSSRLQ